jgi:hypothetical protein
MPSSTSSSERRSWLLTLGGAVVLAGAVLLAVEWHWRGQGYVPTVLDSTQLWSVQRERVYGDSPHPLALLGASRVEYGIDVKTLRELLPNYKPVMLAVNGLYPLSTLRDLAQDPDFHGVVLCDVESNTFIREYFFGQQPYVDYYHQRWTPSWHLHRALLNDWQRAAVIANPDFGFVATLKHYFSGGAPFRNYITYYGNRSGDIDYRKTDPEGYKKHFAATVEGNIARLPKHEPTQWLADIAPVFDWVKAIQARGGEVIFYESPTSGLTREINDRLYPRAEYWDRFVAASPAPVLSANSIPELANTVLPDDSHIDYRDKAAYTRALVKVLVERGLLKR